MKFRNPTNNYEERGGDILSPVWCLLFGPLWLIYRGAYAHALILFLLVVPTGGFALLFYPVLAWGIVDRIYLRRGWIPV